jgi:hypothetical protein
VKKIGQDLFHLLQCRIWCCFYANITALWNLKHFSLLELADERLYKLAAQLQGSQNISVKREETKGVMWCVRITCPGWRRPTVAPAIYYAAAFNHGSMAWLSSVWLALLPKPQDAWVPCSIWKQALLSFHRNPCWFCLLHMNSHKESLTNLDADGMYSWGGMWRISQGISLAQVY